MAIGRPKGSVNKKTMAYLRTNGGELPLDYMLRVMRDQTQDFSRRDEMARSAAPYLHAKLQAIQHSGEITTKFVAELPQVSTTTNEWHKQHSNEKTLQ